MSIIVAVKLNNRLENSKDFQEVLSKYGCSIKTRIGFHDHDGNKCSDMGIILLHFIGNNEILSNLIKDLIKINNLAVKIMEM